MNEIYKEDKGNNKKGVLVFLHYFGGSAESWKWVAEKLSNDYHCVTLNLPGFGGAPPLKQPSIQGFAQHVQEELNSLGIKNFILIGHSMGGKIAMQIAANDLKGTVQQLILIAPSPPGTEPITAVERKRILNHSNLKEAEKTIDNITIQPLTGEQYKLAVETNLMSDDFTWKWWLLQGVNYSIAEKIIPLELPITVLASEDDPVMTFDIIKQRVMQVLEQARLITIRKIGHLSPMEAPDWIAEKIRIIVHSKNVK